MIQGLLNPIIDNGSVLDLTGSAVKMDPSDGTVPSTFADIDGISFLSGRGQLDVIQNPLTDITLFTKPEQPGLVSLQDRLKRPDYYGLSGLGTFYAIPFGQTANFTAFLVWPCGDPSFLRSGDEKKKSNPQWISYEDYPRFMKELRSRVYAPMLNSLKEPAKSRFCYSPWILEQRPTLPIPAAYWRSIAEAFPEIYESARPELPDFMSESLPHLLLTTYGGKEEVLVDDAYHGSSSFSGMQQNFELIFDINKIELMWVAVAYSIRYIEESYLL